MPKCAMNPEPMFRIHHGLTSLTLEVNWKAAVQPTPMPPPAEKPATRRRRRRRKPATKSTTSTSTPTKPPTEPRKPVTPPPGIPEPAVVSPEILMEQRTSGDASGDPGELNSPGETPHTITRADATAFTRTSEETASPLDPTEEKSTPHACLEIRQIQTRPRLFY